MRKIKYISVILVIAVLILLLAGCSRIEVPDILSKSEEKAAEMVKKEGLVPIVEYEYREKEEKGKVFKAIPGVNSIVESGSEVVIYISKGPEKIIAKNAYSRWTSMGKTEDSWNFNMPYVDKGVLYIDCNKVVLKDGITWQESEEAGVSVAELSLTEDFEKTVSAKVKFEKKHIAPFEEQSFVIAVPLEDIGVEKPELLCFRLNAAKDGEEFEQPDEETEEGIRIDFTIEW